MAEFSLDGRTKVKTLKANFKKAFGIFFKPQKRKSVRTEFEYVIGTFFSTNIVAGICFHKVTSAIYYEKTVEKVSKNSGFVLFIRPKKRRKRAIIL